MFPLLASLMWQSKIEYGSPQLSVERRGVEACAHRFSLDSMGVECAVAFVKIGRLAYSRNAQMLTPLAERKFACNFYCFGNSSRRSSAAAPTLVQESPHPSIP